LSGLLADAVTATGGTVHRSGCYIAIDGPQFSTRAESRMYRAWGADVIGMTAMPEARLAREAQLPYGVLAMVTDYDCWHETEVAVEAAEVFRVMAANAAQARAAVRALAQSLPAVRETSPIDTALAGALATAAGARDPRLVAMLDAILGNTIVQEKG
jgi:5'-methylthioadenosine phosphorylase